MLPAQAPASASPLDFFTAADIARALGEGWYKKRVMRLARKEGWPRRRNQNRDEYAVPAYLRKFIVAAPDDSALSAPPAPTVCFADLVGDRFKDAREKVLLRQQAVEMVLNSTGIARDGQLLNLGKELALKLVTSHFRKQFPGADISARTLRRWVDAYRAHGLDGLVEQKAGRVGRHAFARQLEPEQLLGAAAAAIGHGHAPVGKSRGKLNIADGYRRALIGNPTLTGPAREWCHGDNCTKSYVPPSVRDAIRELAPQSVTTLLQLGPKAAKLDGPFSECHYDNVPAGHAFTADDMTANVYVWTEWNNPQGWLLIRPQLLVSMDIGSLTWLNLRAVIRSKGQYNRDDVWGLIGDTLDKFGLFKIAVLEGGTWQSEKIIGLKPKSNASEEDRFGGLQAMGVKVIHTRTPRGKIIEGEFNKLQTAADNVRGYCGRMEMKDCPEVTKKALALCRNGHAHPRQYFLHINEYCAHIEKVCAALNRERNDGKILRGAAPLDKFAELDLAGREFVPPQQRWLYRSAYTIQQVTRNGVRIPQGSGRHAIYYSYAAPELETWRGQRVLVYWNDCDPDTDAVIYVRASTGTLTFLCLAKRVTDLSRFGAPDADSAAEARRKALHHQQAVTKSAALAPYMGRDTQVRSMNPQAGAAAVDPQAAHAVAGPSIQSRLDAAAEAQAERRETKAANDRLVSRADLTDADRAGALELPARDGLGDPSPEAIDDLTNLFTQDP